MKKMIIAREKAGVHNIISDKNMGQKHPKIVYFLPSFSRSVNWNCAMFYLLRENSSDD